MRAAVRRARRIAWELARLATIAVGVALAFGFGANGAASALEGTAGPVTVSVTRPDGGPAVNVKADAPGNVQIYEIAVHLCTHGANVRNSYDFGYQGSACTNTAIGGGDAEKVASFANGVQSATLRSFKLGVGTVQWVNELGYPYELTCGPGQPCDLVVRLQITDATVFFTAPMCFDATCPADPPPTPPTTVVAAGSAGPGESAPTTARATNGTGTAPASIAPSAAPTGSHAVEATTNRSTTPSEESALVSGLPSPLPPVREPRDALRLGGAMAASAAGGARILSVLARLRRQRLIPRMA